MHFNMGVTYTMVSGVILLIIVFGLVNMTAGRSGPGPLNL